MLAERSATPSRGAFFALAATLVMTAATAAAASGPPPDLIVLADGTGIPESLTFTADGTVIVGSATQGVILRAEHGETVAKPWIKVVATDPVSVLGVLADDVHRTLWACSFELPSGADFSQRRFALRTFDLKTGAVKGVFPATGCNDMALGPDGSTYVTDTENMRILRLLPGGAMLESWLQNPQLKRPNGITFVDGKLYVGAGSLFRIDIGTDGSAGMITPLQMERPLKLPDGIRTAGTGRVLVAEMGSSRIKDGVIGQATLVTIRGDHATMQVLGHGYQSPSGITSAGPATALILESKIPYWVDPEVKGQDAGQLHIFALKLPK